MESPRPGMLLNTRQDARYEKYFYEEKYFPVGLLWSEVVQGLGRGKPLRARLLLQS